MIHELGEHCLTEIHPSLSEIAGGLAAGLGAVFGRKDFKSEKP
jgi:hypothetical protein